MDPDREERLRRIMVLWGGGASEATVIRAVTREFSVTPSQVTKDLGDLREYLRTRMDDEGVIDAVMYTSAARANSMSLPAAIEDNASHSTHGSARNPASRPAT